MGKVMSVAIGEANIRIAAADPGTQKLRMVYKEETQQTNAKLMRQITGVLDKQGSFEGIGIASPGLLNASTGVIHKSRALNLKDLKIVNLLEEKYRCPVFLTSRAIAGVMGEHLFGSGKESHHMAYLTFSTGIECGVILNGRLLLGKDGNAHEIGHTVIDSESELICGCGCAGHWEAFTSGSGIPKLTKYLLDTKYNGKKSSLRSIKEMHAKHVFEAAKKGDVVARGIVGEIGTINAIGVANMVNIFDLDLITIGGGVALYNRDAIINPIVKGLRQHTVNALPRVEFTGLGELTVPYGAVADFM